MTNRYSRRALACALLATTALVASPALGQAAPSSPPPIHSNVDANGVDLVTGKFLFSMTEAVIGSGPGAVALKRIWTDGVFKDNWSEGVYVAPDGNTYTDFGNRSNSFTLSGGTYTPRTADGSTLTGSSGSFTYIAADGTRTDYGSPGGIYPIQGYSCLNNTAVGQCAVPLLITKRDGTKFTINWDVVDGNHAQTSFYRFRGVTSSADYGFTVNYATNFAGNLNTLNAPQTNWYVKTGVSFSNSAVTCDSSCGSLAYSSAGGITTVTDSLSRVWRFAASSTQLTGIRRPGETADSTTIAYGSNGVSSVTHDGVTTAYSRSVAGSTATTAITDALSHNSSVVGDLSLDRISSITDQLSHVTSYQYDTSGRPTQMTQPEGNNFQFGYDGRGNVTSTTAVAKSGSGLTNIVSSAAYPSSCTNPKTCNQPTSTTDAKGNVTDYTYDTNHGGLLTLTQPAPTTGAVRPQVRNSYTQITSASGDPVYQLTGVSACQTGSSCAGTSDETKSTVAYNSNLLATSSTRGDGSGALSATDAFTYDPAGNRLTDDGPLSGTADTTRVRYDADREVIGAISADPDGGGALKNRAVRITYRPDGQVSKKEVGTVNSQSDADWANFTTLQTLDIGYWTDARPITKLLSSGGTYYAYSQTNYDALGRPSCTAVRMNPANWGSLPGSCTLSSQGSYGPDRITQVVYDNAGQVTQQLVAVGTSDAATERTMTYSNNGKLASLKDGENNLTTYVYDGFDRLSQTQYPSATKGAGTSNSSDYEQASYNANGNVTSRRLRDGNSIGFSLDNLNRVTLKDLPGSEPDVSYTYDNLGRVLSAIQTGNTLSYTYDALNQSLSEAGPQGTVASQYDLAGRRTQLTYPGSGLYVSYDYLVTGDASAIRENGATSGVGVLASYGYDNLGNRTSVTFGNGASQAFGYDPVSRLTSLTNDLSGTTNDLSVTLAYSPANQITSTVRTGDAYAWTGHGSGSTAFSQNGLNQQVSIGGSAASWDAKGNLTNEPQSGKTYCYSSENLLTGSGGTCASPTVSLAYDPALRLYQISGTSTARFAYDGVNAIAEYDGSNALQHRFVFAPGVDRPIVDYAGTGTTTRQFLGADERGSIVSLSDNSGGLININRYDEYGKPQSTNLGRFQYTGQKWISEAILYDYKARDYLPHLGVFAQTDPVGYADIPNSYVYGGADPVNNSDPTGLCKAETEHVVYWPGSRLPHCASNGDSGSSSSSGSSGGSGSSGSSGGPGVQGGSDSFGTQSGSAAPASGSNTIVVTGSRIPSTDAILGTASLAGTPVLAQWWEPLVPHLLLIDPLNADCACFEEGTLVATPSGLRPIEKIAVGDLVLAKDEKTGRVAAKGVTRLIRPGAKAIYELRVRDAQRKIAEFYATGDHRWRLDGKGWMPTSTLKIGDRIETGLKSDVTVTMLTLTNRRERTFNLEVADWHTFMVGADHLVVHNGCPLGTPQINEHGQLRAGSRGWTQADVNRLYAAGPTGTSTNRAGEPLTVYGTPSAYMLVNNLTNEIFAFSKKNDPSFIPDSRIQWSH